MKLTYIHVRDYGALRDLQLDCSQPLTLVYGRNEAGKSTLLQFIRAVLFGFPSRQQGAAGGAIGVLDSQGRPARIERYAAANGKSAASSALRIVYEDGTAAGEAKLAELLGGISAQLFGQVFAFGLGELQELSTLQGEEISGYIYSAGLGASASRIRQAEKKLAAGLDQMYKPRGKLQPINKLVQRVAELEAALRSDPDAVAEYDHLRTRIQETEQRILQLSDRKDQLAAGLQMVRTALQLSDSWSRWLAVQAQLSGLPVTEHFPEEAVPRLDAYLAEQERLFGELDKLALKREQLQRELDKPERSEVSFAPEAQAELSGLLERSAAYRDNQAAAAELRAELEHAETELGKLLKRIDPGWDEAALAAFPQTIALREQIREFREAFAELAQRQLHAEAEEMMLAREAGYAAAEREQAETALNGYRERHSESLSLFARFPAQEWKAQLDELRRLAADWQQAEAELRFAEERAAHDSAAREQLRSEQRASARRLALVLAALALAAPGALLAA
ncbi:AAA family ATPase, partial [Paenibacillus thalictri]